MKILLSVPAYPTTPHVHGRTWASIELLDLPGPVDIIVSRLDGPLPDRRAGYRDLVHKYEWIRARALLGYYDYLFIVEADMIVPPDALTKLLALDTDVAYGLYCLRTGSHRWNAFVKVNATTGRSFSDDPVYARKAWGSTMPVEGVGLGCALIRRNVLESIPFRLENGPWANDWYFAMDCQLDGLEQVCDLSVICGHISEDGILWPTQAGYELEAF